MVELLVVASLLGFVLGAPLLLFRSAERMRSTVTTRVELAAMVHQTLDRIAGRLEGSSAAVIPQYVLGAGVASALVDYQVADGWNGASVVWRPAERIALLPATEDADDGVDNDSDGLIDERIVVWTTDFGLVTERRMTIRRDVPERLAGEIPGNGIDENGNGLLNENGLSFEFFDDQVVIRLSLEGRDSSGARIEHSEERRIAFRN